MRILGLREKVVGLINDAIAPEGGYVDTDSIKQLSDSQETINMDKDEITLTLVFSKEHRLLAQYIERCVRQATRNQNNNPACQRIYPSPR